jgi:hypothetical protein
MIRAGILVLVCAGSVASVQAADPGEGPADTIAAPPAVVRGVVEIGGLLRPYWQTEPFVGSGNASAVDPGAYGSFALWVGGDNGPTFGMDVYGELISYDGTLLNSTDSYGVLGAHIGWSADTHYVGILGAIGNGTEQNRDAHIGDLIGVEASAQIADMMVFVQAGHADIRVDETDSGFTGVFVEAGAVAEIDAAMAVLVRGGMGYAPTNFADSDDNGFYASIGAKLAYQPDPASPLVLTAGYELAYVDAIEEDDIAVDHTISVGVAMPFGESGPAAALNPMHAPRMPFRAATWADILD